MMSLLLACVIAFQADPAAGSVAGYPSIQAALDAQPGKVLYLPAGDYEVSAAVVINKSGSGLEGPGKIIQTNPDASILEVSRATDVRIAGLTLTRAEGKKDATKHGLHMSECNRVQIDGIRVVDNRSGAGTVFFERCTNSAIRNSAVLNYKRITVDDRTESEMYGYAFKVIDGTGILVNNGQDISIVNNEVIEDNIVPNPETKAQFDLGRLCEGRKPTVKGQLAPKGDYANNWHQGSAIVVTAPEETDHILVSGNMIRHAAQGIDLHADHVTCTNNIIDRAFIGIKCMHGSRNVIISNNNVSHIDLWGIIMMPGTSSHPAEAAKDDKPARGANFTSGNIIANNIFSDFGFGDEYWNWKDNKSGVIALQSGQLKENPVMTDVIITGNIVYDSGKDQIIENGQPVTVGPRYEWAVQIDQNPAPQGLHFSNNLFHPGRSGVSNVELTP